MTNEEIIADVLEKKGITEEAHTAAYWNARSYHVIRGQHAAAACWLWKAKRKKSEENGNSPSEEDGNAPDGWVKVKSYLFLRSQVEKDTKADTVRESVWTYGVDMDPYRHPRLVMGTEVPCEKRTVSSPEEAAELLRTVFRLEKKAEEHLAMVAMTTKGEVIGAFVVAHGGIASCQVCPREIFCRALLVGCASIIIAHNHPSGDSAPSEADVQFTRRLVEAGDLIGIPLSDSIIIGDGRYFSFLESGILQKN